MAGRNNDEDDEPQKSSLMGSLILPVILLLLAGGMGFGFAKIYVVPQMEKNAAVMAQTASADHGDQAIASAVDHAETAKNEGRGGGKLNIVELAPIITNLADPADVWVRAEFSIEFKQPAEAGVAELIQSDFLAFLKTLKLQNLEGSIGFRHLMDDLQERASLKSNNNVNRVLVRAFLVE